MQKTIASILFWCLILVGSLSLVRTHAQEGFTIFLGVVFGAAFSWVAFTKREKIRRMPLSVAGVYLLFSFHLLLISAALGEMTALAFFQASGESFMSAKIFLPFYLLGVTFVCILLFLIRLKSAKPIE